MRDGDEEIAYERGRGYVGDVKFGGRTFMALCRACAISESMDRHSLYWKINGTGLEILRERGL